MAVCLASKLNGVYGKDRMAAVPLFCMELLELCVLAAAETMDVLPDDFLYLVEVLSANLCVGKSIALPCTLSSSSLVPLQGSGNLNNQSKGYTQRI